jgi:hypothetical protein
MDRQSGSGIRIMWFEYLNFIINYWIHIVIVVVYLLLEHITNRSMGPALHPPGFRHPSHPHSCCSVNPASANPTQSPKLHKMLFVLPICNPPIHKLGRSARLGFAAHEQSSFFSFLLLQHKMQVLPSTPFISATIFLLCLFALSILFLVEHANAVDVKNQRKRNQCKQ